LQSGCEVEVFQWLEVRSLRWTGRVGRTFTPVEDIGVVCGGR
jgi:hypothetical protein